MLEVVGSHAVKMAFLFSWRSCKVLYNLVNTVTVDYSSRFYTKLQFSSLKISADVLINDLDLKLNVIYNNIMLIVLLVFVY